VITFLNICVILNGKHCTRPG